MRRFWLAPIIVIFLLGPPGTVALSAETAPADAPDSVAAPSETAAAAEAAAAAPRARAFTDRLEDLFGRFVVAPLSTVIFWDVLFWDNGESENRVIPIVVFWLILGATFFTLRFQFINFRAFRHSFDCVRGVFSRTGETGEISHFQALSAALSATVGLGNIAGVAVAVGLGGPGAVFWMIVAGFLGMSSKFAECTLGQKYKIIRSDGHVSGGPMHYLEDGLAQLGLGRTGKGLSVLFCLMCIGASLGAGNMFQANQSFRQVETVIPWFAGHPGVFGVILAFFVGLVIIGGIKRIGATASILVPFMCTFYVLCGAWILLANASALYDGLLTIVRSAFTPAAGYGGVVGVLVQGFRRAAFSNEAGIGSAAIAHSAATTDEPVREGIVSLLEPFIDTLIVCTMTGLVLVVTGAYQHPTAEGIVMTSEAFATAFSWFPILLSVAATLFAFSTMISWSYYGEQSCVKLFGLRSVLPYKWFFLACVWFGTVSSLENVIDFSDLMALGMAFPNIFGVILLSGKVKADLESYMRRLKAGE
ncbi:MAG: alanine/glycine:cation symporter family protein, partial [Deltaproteobacteria bacterium]|nr:alanine/glycine:cation symporter family protein [Deltaproteobacteria bacterium]